MNEAQTNQTILSIDTAQGGYALGLQASGKFSANIERERHSQADILVPEIQSLLDRQSVSFQDLDFIAVTTGPGLFTGIRVGLSTARSLGLALGVPVVGITCFEALAYQYFQTGKNEAPLIIVLETRRDDFYVQVLESIDKPKSPGSISRDALEDLISSFGSCQLIGNGAERFLKEQQVFQNLNDHERYNHIDPEILIELSRFKAKQGSVSKAEPLYLAPASTSQPKKQQRKLRAS